MGLLRLLGPLLGRRGEVDRRLLAVLQLPEDVLQRIRNARAVGRLRLIRDQRLQARALQVEAIELGTEVVAPWAPAGAPSADSEEQHRGAYDHRVAGELQAKALAFGRRLRCGPHAV